MLPTAKEIRERILQGFDRRTYDSWYRQMCYAFGEKWSSNAVYLYGAAETDTIPVYPDVHVEFLPVGQSRRILNTSIRTLSRVLSKPPLPRFPQLDEVRGEVRSQYWLACANGTRGIPTNWLKQMQYAFVEGDSLGVGAVRHGLRTHPQTGRQVADLKHSPLLQTIWDPFESDPRNSKWVACVSYISYEAAVKRFGKKKAEANKKEWGQTETGRRLDFVRVVEYWDIGLYGKDAAYCEFCGELDEEAKVETNDLGFIPVSFCVNYVAPGMKRPIGRVALQMSTQELLNDIERYMRRTMKKGQPVDILLESMFDEDSLARWKAGDTTQGLSVKDGLTDEDVRKVFNRIPGMEVPQGVLALFGIAERQHNDDSSQTDQERGVALGSRTTAREVMFLNQRAAEAKSLTDQMATEFLTYCVRNSVNTGLAGDTHPVMLDIFGTNVTFNDPNEPQSMMSVWLEEPSSVLIDLEAQTVQDDAMQRAQRKEDLQMVAPLVGMFVDPQTYTDEALKAMGEKNLEKWRPRQPVQQMLGPTPAQQ